jgi:uncharacterized membrane protein
MLKHETVRRIPARAASIEAVLNIMTVIVSLIGAIYTLIMLLVIQGTWTFYKFFGIVEILLTSTIVWQAWKWPRNA